MKPKLGALLAATVTALMACAAVAINSHYQRDKPHHTPTGFINNYSSTVATQSPWPWYWERFSKGLPPPPANNYQFPRVAWGQPDLAWLKANRRETTATWIGHATVLLQTGGLNILTDPHFSERASPFSFVGPKRLVPPGIAFADLPQIDAVVISHNHYDHMDEKTLVWLASQKGGAPRYFVGLGLKKWFTERDISNVSEMDWWDRETYKGVDFTMTPVQHWSARWTNDRFQTLWGGWAIRSMGAGRVKPHNFFFAGDTGYSKDFADIGQRLGPFDLAAIPIGAYAPRWFMGQTHADPAEAVKMQKDLRASTALAIHWGTFELTDEPLDEPPAVLAAELKKAGVPGERFLVLKHGEMMKVAGQ